MLQNLLTESRNPASASIDRLPTAEMMAVIECGRRGSAGRGRESDSRDCPLLWTGLYRASGKGGRLFYIGAGTSGRLGVLDASECPAHLYVPSSLVQGIIAGGDTALRSRSKRPRTTAARQNPIWRRRTLPQGTCFWGLRPVAGHPTCSAQSSTRELGAH